VAHDELFIFKKFLKRVSPPRVQLVAFGQPMTIDPNPTDLGTSGDESFDQR